MNLRTLIFILVIFTSCDNLVRFESPQPTGQREEKAISNKLIGQYRSLNDSTLLTITSSEIVRTVDWKTVLHISKVDSVTRASIHGDTTFYETNGQAKFVFEVRGDSLFHSIDYKDTLVSLRGGDKVRKLKGYFLLNRLTTNEEWIVSKIGRTKDGVVIGTISNKEALGKLRELTNTDSDTVYNFNPTRRQMKQFARDNGFGDDERFIKLYTAANKMYNPWR